MESNKNPYVVLWSEELNTALVKSLSAYTDWKKDFETQEIGKPLPKVLRITDTKKQAYIIADTFNMTLG